jgi:hypothetical protein
LTIIVLVRAKPGFETPRLEAVLKLVPELVEGLLNITK